MGLLRKATSILTLGGVSYYSSRESQAKAAKARSGLAEARRKVAEEQAAVIARALQEDEARRQADLEEVARAEAEAVPWSLSRIQGDGVVRGGGSSPVKASVAQARRRCQIK